jgi:hypothetical protein
VRMKTTFGLAAAALAEWPATDPEPMAIAPAAAAAATSRAIPILDFRRRAMVCREHDNGSDIPVNAPDGRNEEGDTEMRFMLLQNYGRTENVQEPLSSWPPEDARAHIDFQVRLNKDLTERGELVEATALTAPDAAKFVVHDGAGAPVVTDGPFPESKELLAGYRLVDVESLDRALEIAARSSASPGPGGVPIRQPIEVRQVISAPDPEV